MWLIGLLIAAGCELWAPPPAGEAELSRGLVVMYPGSFSTTTEMEGFYNGLRAGGVEMALQVRRWEPFLEHIIEPVYAVERTRARARYEAKRLAEYRRQYADCPITLLGYSGGCLMAILVTEEMPEGVLVDRVILMSAAVSRHYDLTRMLDNTRLGAVHYWSPREDFTRRVAADFGLADGSRDDPASADSFDTIDERLTQISWRPEWKSYGYNGEHWEYLFNVEWIRDFVAPWTVPPHGP